MDEYYPESQDGASEETQQPKTEETGHDTALIPKSLLAGKDFEVGEEVVFKIVHMYEDEVEIEYSYGDEKKGKSDKPEMDAAMDEMGSENA